MSVFRARVGVVNAVGLRSFALFLALLGLGYEVVLPQPGLAQTTAVRLPTSSGEMSCSEAINAVAADLAERGYFIPWQLSGPPARQIQPQVLIREDHIETYYYGYPTDRTESVTFMLSGDSTRLYQGLMSSPQLMSIFGAKVMAECEQVGLVEFSHWWEGGITIGYFSDNTARPFSWIDVEPDGPHVRTAQTSLGQTLQYEWGYFYSP